MQWKIPTRNYSVTYIYSFYRTSTHTNSFGVGMTFWIADIKISKVIMQNYSMKDESSKKINFLNFPSHYDNLNH